MPQMGYDTKTDRLTDCQSQCDFDFDKGGAQSVATCSRWFPVRGFFYTEDGGDTFLRNVG
jgi:hypothetical protein